MKWEGRRQSDNVEDQRGSVGKKAAVGGGIGMLIIALIAMFMGADPQAFLEQMGQGQVGATQGGAAEGPVDPREEAMKEFLSVVLADTEDVWNKLLGPDQYQEPRMVLFRDAVQSACGFQKSAVGPFYCPGDHKLYLDMDFFDQLSRELGAPGDFAQAYVIAHEVGHHIQNLTGKSNEVSQAKRRVSEKEGNALTVRLELQADFLAGVWAHHNQKMKRVLEPGDIEEALNAASRIGDDVLQKRATGRVMPDLFTHGTAEQRVRWFKLGFETGDVSLLNKTFELPYSQL